MSLTSIRDRYGVPAKRGASLTFEGRPATITSGRGHHLYLRFEGEDRSQGPFHPLWEIDWLDGIDHGARYDERVEAFNRAMGEAVFTLPRIADRCGVQYRTLHAWVERGILVPSLKPSDGSGTRALFSERDAGVAQVLAGLRKRGLDIEAIEAVAAELRTGNLARCPACGSRLQLATLDSSGTTG